MSTPDSPGLRGINSSDKAVAAEPGPMNGYGRCTPEDLRRELVGQLDEVTQRALSHVDLDTALRAIELRARLARLV